MSEPTARTPGRTGDQLPETPGATVFLDGRRRRLLFRATHRGTHELDLIIGGFVAPRIAAFTDAEIDALEKVLDMPEPDLADFLTGLRGIPPGADSSMLRAIRDSVIR